VQGSGCRVQKEGGSAANESGDESHVLHEEAKAATQRSGIGDRFPAHHPPTPPDALFNDLMKTPSGVLVYERIIRTSSDFANLQKP
jgi:hypothetical protein